MQLIEYLNDNLPYSKLPHTFKYRLINLAPIKVADKINIAVPDIEVPRFRRYTTYRDVYVTDSNQVFDLASNNAQFWPNWRWLRYYVDGPYTFDPRWQSALLVNNVFDKGEHIFIKNTLILHLKNPQSNDEVIPLITGSYTRLVLHGQFTWAQVKQLITKNVNKVRIMNRIRVIPRRIRRCCRTPGPFLSRFSVHQECFPRILMTKLKEAFKQHKTHSMVIPMRSPDMTHISHQLYWYLFLLTMISLVVAAICFIYVSYAFKLALTNIFPFLEHYGIVIVLAVLVLCTMQCIIISWAAEEYPLPADIALHRPQVPVNF